MRHVGAPLRPRQISLAVDSRPPPQHGDQTDRPRRRELRGECLGRCVAALQPAVAVARDERDRLDRRRCDARGDELCGDAREVPPATLLPRCDERTSVALVDECSPGRGEREAPTIALGTASNRPGAWRPTAVAARRRATDESPQTRVAQRPPDTSTHAASARKNDVEEERHPPTLRHKRQRE